MQAVQEKPRQCETQENPRRTCMAVRHGGGKERQRVGAVQERQQSAERQQWQEEAAECRQEAASHESRKAGRGAERKPRECKRVRNPPRGGQKR